MRLKKIWTLGLGRQLRGAVDKERRRKVRQEATEKDCCGKGKRP